MDAGHRRTLESSIETFPTRSGDDRSRRGAQQRRVVVEVPTRIGEISLRARIDTISLERQREHAARELARATGGQVVPANDGGWPRRGHGPGLGFSLGERSFDTRQLGATRFGAAE
eukprot:1332814-Amorphochlora_amoeboformis.AAC.1